MSPKFTLPVHPLVVGLAARLLGQVDLEEAIKRARAARSLRKRDGVAQLAKLDVEQPKKDEVVELPTIENANQLKRELKLVGTRSRSPDLVVFQGYNGTCLCEEDEMGVSDPPTRHWWHVLFLDARLSSWMLIPFDDIRLYEQRQENFYPFGYADRLWVSADARIGAGDTSTSVDALWLSGDFMRSGDFRASLGSGIGNGASGMLCEAITPNCCKKSSP